MRIIPAIDIIDGKCVRLTRGDYQTKKIYDEHPLNVAKRFEDAGIRYLHLVDLDGAKSNHIVNYRVLETIAANTKLNIDFGGGVKSDADMATAFNCGAHQVTAGSIAVNHPETVLNWLEKYGAEKIILGADGKNGKIVKQGWQEDTALEVVEFIQEYERKGIQHVICTDVGRDGMLQGAAEELYKTIIQKTTVKLVASGGISSIEDLHRMKTIGCHGTIIGKAIYEGHISLEQLTALC
jgi:phosphoribosylformimino-5-aminoimidazole carboxamide ribotide isomerase